MNRWARFGIVLVVTVALSLGIGAVRFSQREAIAWTTIKVGQTKQLRGLQITVDSLGPSELPAPKGMVWLELAWRLSPTEPVEPDDLACASMLYLGGAEYWTSVRPNLETGRNWACTPPEGDPPLVVGQVNQTWDYWLIPASRVDEKMRVKVSFGANDWAFAVTD